jgi:mRNA interferase HigB
MEFMKLLGRAIMERLKQDHPDVAKRIDAWSLEIGEFVFTNPHDLKDKYNTVDFLGNNLVVFNIKGNHYRIAATIDYKRHLVIVERAGTHEEYSKWRLK